MASYLVFAVLDHLLFAGRRFARCWHPPVRPCVRFIGQGHMWYDDEDAWTRHEACWRCFAGKSWQEHPSISSFMLPWRRKRLRGVMIRECRSSLSPSKSSNAWLACAFVPRQHRKLSRKHVVPLVFFSLAAVAPSFARCLLCRSCSGGARWSGRSTRACW